jgi:DNA-binding IclR family transcriptional regulator
VTPQQQKVLDWIRAFHAANGRMPTQRAIAAAFDVSQAAVHSMLERLEAGGAISRAKGKRYGIALAT